ncbi:MAG: hypothetical protein HQK49_06085 [Oligoflexia bacterium]|nr:hypothetical protein [Oligoflexia bacterium]
MKFPFKSRNLFVSLLLSVLPCSYLLADCNVNVKAAMQSKWNSNQFLGNANGDYISLTSQNGAGCARNYINGSIYYANNSNTGGAKVIYGSILAKWKKMGAEKSFLGYPTTDETGTPDKIGRFNHFQHGSIYWYPGADAHEVHGLIRDKWASLGWEKHFGYPISDELVSTDGVGRYSIFQKGRIYYHPTHGTHYIAYGRLYLNWADHGAETGTVGYPTSDPYKANYVLTQNFSKKTLSEKDAEIANSVDLRGEINRRGIAVRTQGGRGTCVQQTMTFILEYALTGLAGQDFNHMSIDYSTQAGNRVSNEQTEPSNFPKYLDGYNVYGTVVAASWPYDLNYIYDYATSDEKMTQTLINNGKFMIRKGLKLTGKFLKRDYQGVVTSIQLSNLLDYLKLGIPVAQAHSGHAEAIVGYVLNSNEAGGGHLILRNSWGPNHADHGYDTITFADFKKDYAPGVELFAFDKVE